MGKSFQSINSCASHKDRSRTMITCNCEGKTANWINASLLRTAFDNNTCIFATICAGVNNGELRLQLRKWKSNEKGIAARARSYGTPFAGTCNCGRDIPTVKHTLLIDVFGELRARLIHQRLDRHLYLPRCSSEGRLAEDRSNALPGRSDDGGTLLIVFKEIQVTHRWSFLVR